MQQPAEGGHATSSDRPIQYEPHRDTCNRTGGKPTGVLCGEPSAPRRRGGNQTSDLSADAPASAAAADGDNFVRDHENSAPEPEAVPEQQKEEEAAPPADHPAAGVPSGRRNPPGGKSSLILG